MTLISSNNLLKAAVLVNGTPARPWDINRDKSNETSGTINLVGKRPFSIELDVAAYFSSRVPRLRGQPNADVLRRNRAQAHLQDCTDLRAEVYLDESHILTINFPCTQNQSFSGSWSKPNDPAIEAKQIYATHCEAHIEIDIFRCILVPAKTAKRSAKRAKTENQPDDPEAWKVFAMWDDDDKPYHSFDFTYVDLERWEREKAEQRQRQRHAGKRGERDDAEPQVETAEEQQGLENAVDVDQPSEPEGRQPDSVQLAADLERRLQEQEQDLAEQRQRAHREQREIARGLEERERVLLQRERDLDARCACSSRVVPQVGEDERKPNIEHREHLQHLHCEAVNQVPKKEASNPHEPVSEKKGKGRAPSLSRSSSKRPRRDSDTVR
ncbi:hypothetical protein FFLO_02596 [Filobasidium floriforme]|uniref:Uncharacterized protein n=1 Tax=Filobasidium floriforme TaxID=5210 RepID=A0A8K0JSJ8_9TREE|nr:hypothetical protein FFLO_02596 [Filobasidium floriforme]